LSEWLEVVVADGSPPAVFSAHQRAWGDRVRQIPVKSARLNGKVAGVIDGLAAASYDAVVLADDDVRYDRGNLEQALGLLAKADAVVPQNYFDPLPWHARWDTGRSLLNRALGHDYAGTAALRRSALPDGEYCGSVLFENLEMLRTISAAGGSVRYARGLYVRRLPPPAAQFCRQRFRQAYDSFAQPLRFAVELAVLPAVGTALLSRRGRRALAPGCLAAVGVAEVGRRRNHGRAVFSADAALWAPAWLAERAVCAWAAVGWRLRGGVPYAGQRLRVAAHRERDLAERRCPQPTCGCRDRSGETA
jgi:glycosyltransferase involved in cell wall biosynthesis